MCLPDCVVISSPSSMSFIITSSSSYEPSLRLRLRRRRVSAVTQCPDTVSAVEEAYGKVLAPVAVEVMIPEVLSAAAVMVPVNVGDAESTMFPVPVTALERVTPPYVRAFTSVSAPVESNVLVAEPPKYAFWKTESCELDAKPREVKPTVDNVPLSVVFPATASVPIVAVWEKRFVELAVVAKKLVVVALLATSEDEYIFVEVELVKLAFVEKRFVVVAEVPVAFTKVRLVVDATAAARLEVYEFVEVALVVVAFVYVRLVPEMVVAMRLVMVAAVAVSVSMMPVVKCARVAKRFVDVALVKTAAVACRFVDVEFAALKLVVYTFVDVALVEVELVKAARDAVRLVVDAVTAFKLETYAFVEVALVVVALVYVRLVPEMVVATRSVIVVVAAVRVEMTLVVKRPRVAKRFVVVALVPVALVNRRFVVDAVPKLALDAYRLVVVAFMRVVDVATRFVVVALVMVALATVSVPAAPVRFSAPETVRSPVTVVVASEVAPEEESVVAETDVPETEPPRIVGVSRSTSLRCSMRPTLAAAA